jgi:hypothetical protein
VPRLLDLFHKYEIHATWATVGFLFFETRSELLAAQPDIKPRYKNKILSPYEFFLDEVGEGEESDPLHFAPSLIHQILQTPYQELATHTFSHYYCLEDGQTPEDFARDLRTAIKAAEIYNCKIESIVFPRNQYAAAYLDICAQNGILAFRGNESVWFRNSASRQLHRLWYRRVVRFMDAYVNISGANSYLIPERGSLPINLPSSRYLRPFSKRLKIFEPLRLKRILLSMTSAAKDGHIFHLWWHPEDFSGDIDANFLFLEKILIKYTELKKIHGMQSFTMGELVAKIVSDN